MAKSQKFKEKDLARECKYALQLFKNRRQLDFWFIPVQARIVSLGKRKIFIPNEGMVGFSDCLILVYGGPDLFCELKTESGRQSPGQIAFQERIERAGRKYHLVRKLTDLLTALAPYGITL